MKLFSALVFLSLAVSMFTACASEIKPVQVHPTEIADKAHVPDLPKNFSTWARYTDSRYDFSIPHPLEWQRAPLQENAVLTAIAFNPPPPTDARVTVRVVELQNLALHTEVNAHPFQTIPGYGLLQQGKRFGSQMLTQKLTGEIGNGQSGRERTHTALFKQRGKGYIIQLRYGGDGAENQNLQTIFFAMVEGFRLKE